MDDLYIVTAYVHVDAALLALGEHDDCRSRVSGAEILTVALVAARYFQNHQERALSVLCRLHYLPRLSISRFNRRLPQLLRVLRRLFAHLSKRVVATALVVVDAMPVLVCKRVRQRRCRKVRGERFVGYCEAKREWFFGYKLHWCCDAHGLPLAFTLRPARRHERSALTLLLARRPRGTLVVGDGAYVSRPRAHFWGQRGIRLIGKRYGRMSPNPPDEQVLLRQRHVIEVAHAQLESMGLQRLRARTRAGFCLKVSLSLIALLIIHLVPN
jgi:IS5 family transposase